MTPDAPSPTRTSLEQGGRERSPLRVRVRGYNHRFGSGGPLVWWRWACPGCCEDGAGYWSHDCSQAMAQAGDHARTCPALRLARLEAELEKLAAQYTDLAELEHLTIEYARETRFDARRRRRESVSDVYRLAADDLTAILARHRQASHG